MKIDQIIVVEGKTDVAKIKKALPNYEIDFLISGGLGFDKKFLELCKSTNKKRGIIVFTDPDGPGNKIREKINEALDFKCLNAFIDKKKIINSKKIGIAEANEEDIIFALNNLISFKGNNNESISWKEYLDNDINLSHNRRVIANYFSWSEKINAKTLFKWLNYSRLNVEDVLKILRGENEG